jgi:hypothetical protein
LGAGALALFGTRASAAALKDDIEIVRGALALHPGLLRYNTPATIEAGLAALARDYVGAAGGAEQFLSLSRFLSVIRCGHTHCNPYNQSDTLVADVFDRRTRLPFRFRWLGGRMVMLDTAADGAIPRGSEILRLNGERPARLLDALLAYARADGGNDAKRAALMEVRGGEKFETFDIFQGLIAPPTDGAHRIRYRRPDGVQREIELPAMSLAGRQAQSPPAEVSGEAPLWKFEMREGVGLLSMPTWVMYKTKWDWEAWLDERLRSLDGARGLVIDLRENEGGNDCGEMILSRLATRDIALPGYRKRVRYQRTPEALDPFLDTWDDSFRRAGENALPAADGFFDVAERETGYAIRPEGPRITVPVAALISPTCSSATFSFARRAQQAGLIRLFGEETGGNLKGINGGAYFFVRLPGSGLEFDLPVYGYFPETPQPDQGVRPDERVAPTARDIAAGRDPCLARAIAWSRENDS